MQQSDLQAVGWNLPSTVITLDALHTVRDTAQHILDTGANSPNVAALPDATQPASPNDGCQRRSPF